MSVVLSQPCKSQVQAGADESIDSFIRDYKARLPDLRKRYSTNRKIRYRYTDYAVVSDDGRKAGDVVSTSINELITDGNRIRVVVIESVPPELKDTHRFWRPDVQFGVTQKDGGYTITDLKRPNSRNYSHESARYEYFAHEPIRAGGKTLATAFWCEDFGPDGPTITIERVGSTTWRGKKCLEVRSRWDVGDRSLEDIARTYLDPDHRVTLGTETGWLSHPGIAKRYKLIDEIDYEPSHDGILFPKSSRQTVEWEDGSSGKVHDVEFLAYEYYTPAPEEFELEGRYRLRTPYLSPPQVTRPPLGFGGERRPQNPSATEQAPTEWHLSGKMRRWGVLAALGVLTTGIIVIVRRTTRRKGKVNQGRIAGRE
jgi:hypothetical protein